MRPEVVFIPGAFVHDNAFWWAPVAALTDPYGIKSHTYELPSCGDVGPLGDLHADAADARKLIESCEGPVIVVGHSYGGQVATEAASGMKNKVMHIIYLSGIVTDVGIINSDYIKVGTEPEVDFRDDGTIGEGPGTFKSNELKRLQNTSFVKEALTRVTRMNPECFVQAPNGVAWKEGIPTTYVLGLDDGEVARDILERQAARCDKKLEWPANHFVHLDRPDLMAELILSIAGKDAGAFIYKEAGEPRVQAL
jgi:pimeloyl-ACP methyl ester carboxylesterase